MKRVLAFWMVLIATVMSSCKNDSQLQQEAVQVADKEFEQMDLSHIDQYPLFEDCDELEKGSACFYSHLYELLSRRLQKDKFALPLEARDSIVASLSVGVDGSVIVIIIGKKTMKLLDSLRPLPFLKVRLRQMLSIVFGVVS